VLFILCELRFAHLPNSASGGIITRGDVGGRGSNADLPTAGAGGARSKDGSARPLDHCVTRKASKGDLFPKRKNPRRREEEK